jgi:hypothetical protein
MADYALEGIPKKIGELGNYETSVRTIQTGALAYMQGICTTFLGGQTSRRNIQIFVQPTVLERAPFLAELCQAASLF